MRRLVLAMMVTACGGTKPTPDAGPMIDTSCGIDCAAQQRFGLIAGTCFEYSDTATSTSPNPPALAAEVLAKTELEGGLPVMKVLYTTTGNRKLQDSFTIVDGELKLVRREFGSGGTSVSYKKSTGELQGAKWLQASSGVGENYVTQSAADVIAPPAARVTHDTTYRVTTSAPGAGEASVPYGPLDGGVKLLITESPTDHGSDSRRVWVPGLGFALISTPLTIAGGTPTEYRLQNVKLTADGGLCGF